MQYDKDSNLFQIIQHARNKNMSQLLWCLQGIHPSYLPAFLLLVIKHFNINVDDLLKQAMSVEEKDSPVHKFSTYLNLKAFL